MKLKNHFNLFRLSQLALALSATTAMGGTETMTTAPAVPSSPTMADWLKVSGYAGVTYSHTDDGSETFLDGGSPSDAVKVGFQATQGDFGAYASLFYTPDSFSGGHEVGILDAYLTYKTGNLTFTGGKYLSWLGYEAFDLVNMTQITYANSLGAIPAYHSGIKAEYATDTFGAGVNVSDSIRGGDGFWTGDEDLSNGLGYEAYVVYKGIEKLTLWGGVAYENADGKSDFSTYDLWASYDISKKITVAAEVAYNDNGPTIGTQGLLYLKYSFTDKFSTVVRAGADLYDTGGDDTMRYTLAPTYAFTDYFLLRGELTFKDVDKKSSDSVFSGVQAVLKF